MSENARLCVALIQEKTAEVLRHLDAGIVQAGYHSVLRLDVVGALGDLTHNSNIFHSYQRGILDKLVPFE